MTVSTCKPFVFIGTANYGPLYIQAVLKKHGFPAYGLFRSLDDALAKVPDPGFIGFSCWTGGHEAQYRESIKARQRCPQAVIGFGGPHAILRPGEVIEQQSVDLVCIGEGEEAMLELAQRLAAGESHLDIRGLWVKDHGGRVHRNPQRPLVEDLDSLPFLDREGFLYDHPGAPHSGFQTGRGCLNNCGYCYNTVFRSLFVGKYFRKRSVSNVLEEINTARRKQPYSFIKFKDDTFISSRTWLREFAERYPKEVGLPFAAQAIVTQLDAETLTLLRQAGCASVAVGFESGNEFIRTEVLGKKITKERILEMARLAKEIGPDNLVGHWIIACPYETLAAALESIELHLQIGDRPIVHFYTPYPDTKTTNMAIAGGYLAPENAIVDSGLMDKIYLSFSEPLKEMFKELLQLFYLFDRCPARFPEMKSRLLGLPDENAQLREVRAWRTALSEEFGTVEAIRHSDTNMIAMYQVRQTSNKPTP